MGYVKVWNDNKFDNTEKFKGNLITIKAGKFIEMTEDEAEMLLGQFKPMKFDHNDQPTPDSFKMLRIERDPLHKFEADPEFTCMLDGKKFPTQEALSAHIKANYSDKVFVDPLAEKEMKTRGRPPAQKTA